MGKSELIQDYLHRLPESDQAEVLDFIEFLVARSGRGEDAADRDEFLGYSLDSAMRGMEGEEFPVYEASDIKERFS